MPYRGRYSRRTNYRRPYYANKGRKVNRTKLLVDGHDTKPNFVKAVQNTGSLISAIPGLIGTVSNIMSMINVEKKYLDTSNVVSAVNIGAPYFQPLTYIAQGDTQNQRNGMKVLLQNVSLRFTAYVVSAMNLSYTLRVLLVCDKELEPALGETAAQKLSKIFQDYTVHPVETPVNRLFSKRFVILKDKKYTMSPVNVGGRTDKFYVKTPFHLDFDGVNATDSSDNTIYMIFLSDAAGGGDQINLNWYARVNFTDN